jgi:hypothetical protein
MAMNLLGDNMDTLKKNTETLIDASKKARLEYSCHNISFSKKGHFHFPPLTTVTFGKKMGHDKK